MTTKKLRIIGCSDGHMWYARLVGQLMPYEGSWPEGFKSREPAGYLNIVKFEDAVIEEVS